MLMMLTIPIFIILMIILHATIFTATLIRYQWQLIIKCFLIINIQHPYILHILSEWLLAKFASWYIIRIYVLTICILFYIDLRSIRLRCCLIINYTPHVWVIIRWDEIRWHLFIRWRLKILILFRLIKLYPIILLQTCKIVKYLILFTMRLISGCILNWQLLLLLLLKMLTSWWWYCYIARLLSSFTQLRFNFLL